MKEEILRKLKDNTGRYVSGEALSDELGVTRAAVWKYIKELREEGYEVESSSKKGYKLEKDADILNALEIKYGIKTAVLGKYVHYFKTIGSTNSYAKKLASEGCEEGTVVVADSQMSGRGRLGRSWNSPGKKGIWMSVVLRPRIEPGDVQIITLAAANAVAAALKTSTGMQAAIKWPNDIVAGGKKLCGILTEMSTEMDRVNYVILGIGMNVSQELDEFEEDIRDKATSLKIWMENSGPSAANLCGKLPFRSSIIKDILFELEKRYDKIKSGSVREVVDEWKRLSATIGKVVVFSLKDRQYTGTAEDITQDGRLVIRCEDGVTREVLSGEVSVRGLLGYV